MDILTYFGILSGIVGLTIIGFSINSIYETGLWILGIVAAVIFLLLGFVGIGKTSVEEFSTNKTVVQNYAVFVVPHSDIPPQISNDMRYMQDEAKILKYTHHNVYGATMNVFYKLKPIQK